MYKRKGLIAVIIGIVCAFVMSACGVLGADYAKKKSVESVEDSGTIEVEEETKEAYATGGQLSFPLAALNGASVILNNSTAGANGSVTLQAGYVYLFEVWGAQGGGGGAGGGYGGYSKGYYEGTGTVYYYVGGQGTTGTSTGARAGGANGGGVGYSSASATGGGGGGATHIATRSGTLQSLESYKSSVLIVAGGGGGSDSYNGSSKGGVGGGETGGAAATTGGDPGKGGTQSAGGTGTGGVTTDTVNKNISHPGTFGKGGGWTSGTQGNMGGGGGGWYGGSSGMNSGAGGGGGSGYVGGVKWQNGTANGSAVSFSSTGMMSSGAKSGNGQVKITRFTTITIKTAPNYTSKARGVGFTVTNTDIAHEYNASSYGLQFDGNVYYKSGSSYINARTGANKYIASTSTTVVTNNTGSNIYNQTMTITPNVYMSNQQLYFKMHSLKYNFDIYLPFKLSTTNNNAAEIKAPSGKTVDGREVRLGDATATTPPAGESVPESGVLNPAHSTLGGRRTMFVTKPIGTNSTFTVSATDFYTDTTDKNIDGVYIMSATANGNDADFSTTLKASTTSTGVLNASNAIAFATYDSITIKPKTTDNSAYMRLTLTLRNYERKPNYTGVVLPSGATLESSGFVRWAEWSVDIVFRLDNTRPVPMSGVLAGSKTDASVTVKSGETAKIYVNQFAYDPDKNVNRINSVKIPNKHFVAVKKDGETLADLATSSVYYNYRGSLKTGKAAESTYMTGMGSTDTGFSGTWLSEDEADEDAFVSYRIRTESSNGLDYIEFTGIRATGNIADNNKWADGAALGDFYVLVNITDEGEATDTGIWLPIAIRVTDGNSAVNNVVPNVRLDKDKAAIFTPWGLSVQETVGSKKELNTYGMGVVSADNAGSEDKFANTVTGKTEGVAPLNYLATDRDNFISSSFVAQQNDPLFIAHNDVQNKNIVSGNTAATNSDFAQFFDVEFVPIYLPKGIFSGLANYDDLLKGGYISEEVSGVVSIKGLKITAKKSTQNVYIEFDVKVVSARGIKDGSSSAVITAPVRCMVNGNTPTVKDPTPENSNNGFVANTLKASGNAVSRFERDGSGSDNFKEYATVTVEVKRNQTLKISPYDIVKDADLPEEITADNSNPADLGFTDMQTATNKAYKVKFSDTATGALVTSGSMYADGLRMDRLRFGTLGFVQNDKYASIVRIADENIDSNASRTVDQIVITGLEKPNSQSVYASTTVTVYDTSGTLIMVTLQVRIVNSKPQLSRAARERDYFRLSASGNENSTNAESLPNRSDLDSDINTNQFYDTPSGAASGNTGIQSAYNGLVYYNVREFTVRELVYDVDTSDRDRGLISIRDFPTSEEDYEKNPYNYTRVINSDTGEYEFVPLKEMYVRAEMANGTGNRSNELVLRVTGLNSTQGLSGGLFLKIVATDGYDPADLFLQFEVMDSAPVINEDGLQKAENGGTVTYTWEFEDDLRTNGKSKYIVSDDKALKIITDSGKLTETNGTIANYETNKTLFKVIASDPDVNQKVVPVATASGNTGNLPVVSTAGGVGAGVLEVGVSPSGSDAVWLTNSMGSVSSSYKTESIKLVYFDDNGNIVKPADWKTSLDYNWVLEIGNAVQSSTTVELHFTLASSNRNAIAYGLQTDNGGAVSVNKEKTYDAGTEGGFGAATGTRTRGDGTTVYDDKGAVANSVHNPITVNLNIVRVPEKLINNFEIVDFGNGKTNEVDGLPVYYAEYVRDKDDEHYIDDPYVTETTDFTYEPIKVSDIGSTAVPLSYFARSRETRRFPNEMLSTVNFATDALHPVESIGNFSYAREQIRIFDDYGNSWTGTTLNDNPYVNVEWAEPEEIFTTSKGAKKYINYGKPVYDSTISTRLQMSASAEGDTYSSASTILYTEDTRGIKLTKKYQRSNENVYISLNLCEWRYAENGSKTSIKKGETYNGVVRISDFDVPNQSGEFTYKPESAPVTTVTVRLDISNSKMSLDVNQSSTASGVSGGNAVIRTSVGAANSAIFLSNLGPSEEYETLSSVYSNKNAVYTVRDNDNVNRNSSTFAKFNGGAVQKDLYRDKGLFFVNGIDGESDEFFTKSENQTEKEITNYINGASNQSEIQEYLGGDSVPADFNPNPGYKNYFTFAGLSGDTGLLSIRPIRKTSLDIEMLKKYQNESIFSGLDPLDGINDYKTAENAEVLDKYAQKFDLHCDTNGFYYPLKLLAYDDYDGSGLLKASLTAVTVKIYIDNSAPSVNTMITDSGSTNTVKFSLSVTDNPTREFDIATLINDTNMLRNESNNANYYYSQTDLEKLYPVAGDNAKDNLLKLLTTDYIKSVKVYDNNNAEIAEEKDGYVGGVKNEQDTNKSEKPVSYWIVKNTDVNGGAYSTINFKANQRVSQSSVFNVRFYDNHDNVVAGKSQGPTVLQFVVTVANNRPEIESGANSFTSFTMKTGQSFYLLATHYNNFDMKKVPSGQSTPNSITAWEKKDESWRQDYMALCDQEMEFKPGSTTELVDHDGAGNLGSLVVFTDDTPWALRFNLGAISISSDILRSDSNTQMKYVLLRDDSDTYNAPLAYKFTADAPGNVTLRVRAYDESTTSYRDWETRITIVSTLPTAKSEKTGDHKLGEGLDVFDKNVDSAIPEFGSGAHRYSYAMNVGDSRTFKLTDFAYDIDNGDDAKMKLAPIQGTTYFFYNINHNITGESSTMLVPDSASNKDPLVSVTERGENYFTVVAEDFSLGNEKYASTTVVRFYIADGSGATGQVVVDLWITVNPAQITVNEIEEPFKVKSVLDYRNDPTSSPSSFNIVARPDDSEKAANAVFLDKDLAAKSTKYTLKIYAMTVKGGEDEKDTDYTQAQLAAMDDKNAIKESLLLFDSNNGGSVTSNSNTASILEYITAEGIKFNATTGVLEIVPKKSTPVDNLGKPQPIKLYVEISKAVADRSSGVGADSSITANSVFEFSVANSAPTATPEVSDNMNSDRTRFLTFNAYRGDERIYTVYDPKVEDRKMLFEDSDVGDTLTVTGVTVKVNDKGDPMIYKLVSEETEEGSGVYETRTVYYGSHVLAADDTGRGDAITTEIRSNGTINATVRFKVNRRITTDKYNNLPTYVVYTVAVRDSANNTARTDVTVMVNNSEPSLFNPDTDDKKVLPENVTMSYDGMEYSMVIRLERNAADTVLDLRSFYDDKDFDPDSYSSDSVVFKSGPSGGKYYDGVGSGAATVFGNRQFDNLFSVNATRYNASLIFRALSYERGESVDTVLIISDDTGAPDVTLNIKLIIDNTAPTFNDEVSNELYIMGNNTANSEYDDALDPVEYNLYDFILDPNANDLNPDNENRVQIGAQGGTSSIVLSQRLREVTHNGEIVNENLVYVVPSADKFQISPRAGYYGYQEITINMRDGSLDGEDTKYSQFTLMVYVTRNPSDVPVKDLSVTYNILTEITPNKLFGEAESVGFVIKTIEKTDSSSVLDVTSQDNSTSDVKNAELKASKKWFVRALNENGTTSVRVEIAILGREDGDTVWQPFTITNVVNRPPELTSRYNVQGNVMFNTDEMVNNTVTIPAAQFVTDLDENDVITLKSVKSKKSIVVDAAIDSVNQYIMLNFKGRGTSLITVKLTDASQREYTYTFVAENIDLPQLNFFMRIGANVQNNPLIYTIILCGILLFLIILIIIIAAAKKKKRMREEIEALLVSEMELEEQMLKLASSPAPTFYQSYGYLSPTQNVQNNPQFMLGEGTNNGASGANPNALGLNAGGGAAPNQNAPTIDDNDL